MTSREIMAGDLSQRVPASGRGDEFDRLAANLNAMLDRIEDLITGIKQVQTISPTTCAAPWHACAAGSRSL